MLQLSIETPKTASKRIAFADGLRGLAALWVVLFHMSEGGHLTNLERVLPESLWLIVFGWGHLGVPVFFLLSGFVMAMTIRQLRFDLAVAGKFVFRRLIRLSPPYYFAIIFALGFGYVKAVVLGSREPVISFSDLFVHMAYLQLFFFSPVINTVFWTLCIEVQFYIAFAILILIADSISFPKGRYWAIGVACVFALIWPAGIADFEILNVSFLGFWYAFLAGVLVCWGSGESKYIRLAALAYCLILLGLGVVMGSSFAVTVAISGLSLLLASALGAMGKWLNWSWIQSLGLISYSLYLLHNPLTGAAFRVDGNWLPAGWVSECLSAFLTLGICLLGSWLAYRWVERPSIGWSHLIPLKSFRPAGLVVEGK